MGRVNLKKSLTEFPDGAVYKAMIKIFVTDRFKVQLTAVDHSKRICR